jgi:hypothetical protein
MHVNHARGDPCTMGVVEIEFTPVRGKDIRRDVSNSLYEALVEEDVTLDDFKAIDATCPDSGILDEDL